MSSVPNVEGNSVIKHTQQTVQLTHAESKAGLYSWTVRDEQGFVG